MATVNQTVAAVNARASEIAGRVEREIRIMCNGQPDFQAILLQAVASKLSVMAGQAETRAALKAQERGDG